MGVSPGDKVNVSTLSDNENGVPQDISTDALQLAALGHKEELGMYSDHH